MRSNEKLVYWLTATWSILATVLNIIGVIWFPPEKVTFAMGLSSFLFIAFGHISYIIAALVFGARYRLKRWAIWLSFLHPVVALVVFTAINWSAINGGEVPAPS
jgi:energy-coupling factor transporter transmembrane protein EcfT